MFFARPEPLELAAAELLALRMSLNTPVVSTAELPVGPARAALVVHSEDGVPNVTVAIRSLRTDEAVHYSFEGDLGSDSSVAVALDAGLSFAETMGFLFGEEEIADDDASRARAYEHWTEVAWGAVPPAEPGEDRAEAPAPGSAAGGPDADREFLLDELANSLSAAMGADGPELMLELEEEVPAELELEPREPPGAPAPAAPAPAPAPAADLAPGAPPGPAPDPAPARATPGKAPETPPPSLTKFRPPAEAAPPQPSAPAAPPEDANETTQHALGRLKLVKRRRGRAASEKPHPILRLLSSF